MREIIEKFEPVNVRDDFEYAFKMFSQAMDAVMPKKEAKPFINDFEDASKIRQLMRTYYEGGGQSLRVNGKKVQVLIDDRDQRAGPGQAPGRGGERRTHR